ncbi:MAG TPA: AI-2E family transporter YdiK [Candidatus Eisenbacteria bacterium]|nr:AI-2E family transporter YdiK [Candidatus Eisenbacteria bacterium]
MTDEGPRLPPARDLGRTTLGVAFLVGMIVGTLWIIRPFLGPTIWATTIVVASWPLMQIVERWLGGRRALSTLCMTVLLVLCFVIPLTFTIVVIAVNVDVIVAWVTSLGSLSLPQPPAWLERVPLVGATLAAQWRDIVSAPGDLATRFAPYARTGVGWLLGLVGGVAGLAVDLLIIVAVSAYLYARGEEAAEFLRRFAHRLAGPRGERSVALAGGAIRGIAQGVIVTALIQALLAGLGLAAAGVPFAPVLTAVGVVLGIAQVGTLPVLAPAVGWLYWTAHPAWATALLVWTVFVVSIDNVIRPLLIRRGADLPLPLIFAGVLGGILGFGIIGIFIGPVVLAVSYALLVDWIESGGAESAPPSS